VPDPKSQQDRLLAELIRGEIDQSTYERRLFELREGAGGEARRDTASGGRFDTPAAPQPFLARPAAGAQSGGAMSGGALRPGATLAGQFRVREQLGRGGMGEVWRAYDTIGDRDAVIKVLPRELQGNTEEMDRVQQTFRRVHDLQHQHICPTHFLGQDPQVGYFLVMKFVDGVTLREYWKRASAGGGAPLSQITAILTPVADGLDYAHRKKVVHRDIKPDNIMVSRDGRDPQIVDFGLAAEIRSSQARVTKARIETGGTFPCMSPEQWRGQPQDGRADQYALAVVAYELVAGRLPFGDRDPKVMRKRVLSEPPPAIPQLPLAVTQVLARGLAKDPAQRFESCLAFTRSLAAALAGVASNRASPPPALPPGLPESSSRNAKVGSGEYSGALPPPVDGSSTGEHTLPTAPRPPSLPRRLWRKLARLPSRAAGAVRGVLRKLPRPHALPNWAWVVLGAILVLIIFVVALALLGNPFSGGDFDH
jgi:serine/threonine protein kinase